jgi:hypothetical protein
MAMRSKAQHLTARTLDRGFEFRSRHEHFSFFSLSCVVLCRYRTCDELNTVARSPTVCRKTDREHR